MEYGVLIIVVTTILLMVILHTLLLQRTLVIIASNELKLLMVHVKETHATKHAEIHARMYVMATKLHYNPLPVM